MCVNALRSPEFSDNHFFCSTVDSTIVFWTPEVNVGDLAAFQLSLTAPTNLKISSLPITSLAVHFSDDVVPVVVQHLASNPETAATVRRIDLGHVSKLENREVEANLRWQSGATIVFSGAMSSDVPISLKVRTLILGLTITQHCGVVYNTLTFTDHQTCAEANGRHLEDRDSIRTLQFPPGIDTAC
jgi:hypothetical protein